MLEENAIFRPRNYKIDWKKIAALNFDSFNQNALDDVQDLITNITFCDIEKEIKPDNNNNNLIKLFKLAQYLLEYMMYSQNSMSQKLINIEKGITKKDKNLIAQQKYYNVTKEKLNYARNEIKKLNKTLKSYKEILLLCSMNNWNVKDLIHQCPYCVKAFISDKYLISHMERRHGFKSMVKGTPSTHEIDPENHASDPAAMEDMKANGDGMRGKNNLFHSTPRKLNENLARTKFKAKHYVKRKPAQHGGTSFKEEASYSQSSSSESKSQLKQPVLNGARQEAFVAFQSLCRSQEMKYLEEMKGFKDSLDTHMKEVADRIIGIVKDRITPTPGKKDLDQSSEPALVDNAVDEVEEGEDVVKRPIRLKSSSLPQVQIKEFKKIKAPVKQNRSKSIESRRSDDISKQDGTTKQSKAGCSKEPPKSHGEKSEHLNEHVQELEKSFENRLREQETKWQQRLEMLEQRYTELSEERPKTEHVDCSAKKANNILQYPKVAKKLKENWMTTQGRAAEAKVNPDIETRPIKPQKTATTKPQTSAETMTETIPALLKKYANTELPHNDAINALKVKIQKSLDKEMTKYGINTSSHITKDNYDIIVKNLERKENSISQVYPNYVTIKRNVMDILENYTLHDKDHNNALTPSSHRDDVKYTIPPAKLDNNLGEESGSTFTLTPESSQNSSEAEDIQKTAKEPKSRGSINEKTRMFDSSEDEAPTRDVGIVPALIHPQPTLSQKSGAEDSTYESSESQVSYDDFLPNPTAKTDDIQEQQRDRRKVVS